MRAELGVRDGDCVVGFTGTFGGWHGIDVLAAAIPRICADGAGRAKFLLIGDGTHKPQLDAEAIARARTSRTACVGVGRVPQAQGARLLKACDIYVSPHSSHMVDSQFFGSPTKLFEYMAMAAASSRAISSRSARCCRRRCGRRISRAASRRRRTNERSCCTPGDVEEFVAAVVALVRRPDIAAALGRNARQAVAEHYSWQRHVARIWLRGRLRDHPGAR